MKEFICYPKCSTCKKALKHLESKNIQIRVRDIIKDKLSFDEIKKIYSLANTDIKKMFNTSGNKYKELNLKDKLENMTLEEKLELLSSDGMLLKRPILILENKVIISYKKESYDDINE